MIKPGRYRHYKGQEYEVVGTAKHSETEEEFVVYRQHMFAEQVHINGQALPRFQFLQEPPV
jgi:hypothetical protein